LSPHGGVATGPHPGRHTLTTVEAVRLYTPRRRLVVLLLGAAGFVAAGLTFILTSVGGVIGDVIGVLGVAFFGSAGVYILVELVHRRPTLLIDADGITDRSSLAAAGRLLWSEIGVVTIYSVGGQRMLGILPSDPGAAVARTTPIRRALLRMNAGFGFPAINLPEVTLPYPLERLIDEMRRHNPDLQVSAE
jgi:hypothetical protein